MRKCSSPLGKAVIYPFSFLALLSLSPWPIGMSVSKRTLGLFLYWSITGPIWPKVLCTSSEVASWFSDCFVKWNFLECGLST